MLWITVHVWEKSTMTGFKLDERIRLSVELALTATSNNSLLLRKQEASARAIGMKEAEIDVARRGFSFDLKTSMAIALALAVCEENRQRALRTGLCARSCAEIEKMAAAFRQSSS
jgi:hypothetical protein